MGSSRGVKILIKGEQMQVSSLASPSAASPVLLIPLLPPSFPNDGNPADGTRIPASSGETYKTAPDSEATSLVAT